MLLLNYYMEKQIKELLNKLNIDLPFEKDNKYYVVKIDSYDDFIKIYNKFEKSLEVFKNSLASFLTEEDCHVQYETDSGFIFELVGIFDDDDYTINISKDKDN